ncbi:MAG: Rrf2 family transcriptional regulator [Armatimonadetes bacterium]|nr:Rrf2 family transcriptional regulator [Armatimonadota bacterium]
MLSLSKKIDYALLALSYLAHKPYRAANTKEIAEEYALPVELLAKILQKLAKAEILVSTSGPTGGYRLLLAPEKISVGAIVDIIEGRPALVQCMRSDSHSCDQIQKCTIRTPLMRVNARMLDMLDEISLAEICKDETESHRVTIPLLVRS